MKYVLLYISLFFNLTYVGQFNIEAFVNQNKITVDEYVKYTIKSNERVRLTNLSFENFVIRQGPFTSSSSQTTIINGKFEQVKEFSYSFILSPKKEGDIVIESIQVNFENNIYQTKPITISVSKGKTNKPNQGNQNTTTKPPENNTKFFAKISSPKRKLFVGENILLEYKIYASTYHIRNLEITDYELPMSNDVWTELIEPKNKQWKEKVEVINGIQYRVFTLKKEIVSPQKSGDITILPFEVKTVVNRDFFNRGKSKTLKSNSLKLKVRALPPNPPISFTGQIGRNYKLNVDVKKTLLKVDDPLDIHIEISGNGNLKQLDMPKLSLPQDLEKYPEETKSNIKVSENGIYGKKKLHQLVIPRFHGEYKIPTISFSYFDLNSGKYKTLKHPETIITVEKTDKSSASNTINFEKPQQDEVVTINDNIRHIKTETELFDFSSPIFGTAYYWGLLASSPVILLLFLVFFSNKEKFTNSEKTLLKQINKQTQVQLSKAEVNFSSNSLDQFYKEIYSLWISLISKKYSIDMAELNRSSIYQVLEKNKVNPDIIRSIDEILTKCEMAQYSPLSSDDADICLSKTKELVQNLKDNA